MSPRSLLVSLRVPPLAASSTSTCVAVSECAIEGCSEPNRARGWCNKHYQRWLHKGTTDMPPPIPAAVLAHVEQILATRNVDGRIPLDIFNRLLDDMHDLNCRQTAWSCSNYWRYGLHAACHHCHPKRSAA